MQHRNMIFPLFSSSCTSIIIQTESFIYLSRFFTLTFSNHNTKDPLPSFVFLDLFSLSFEHRHRPSQILLSLSFSPYTFPVWLQYPTTENFYIMCWYIHKCVYTICRIFLSFSLQQCIFKPNTSQGIITIFFLSFFLSPSFFLYLLLFTIYYPLVFF